MASEASNAYSRSKLKIVALEEFFCPIPPLKLPTDSFSLTVYERTPIQPAEIVHSRIHDADVIILTTFPLSTNLLCPKVTPNLQAIMVMASGTDHIDLKMCRERGIRVMNSPRANTEAVAEHAIALYFAVRRKVALLHRAVVRDEWLKKGTLLKMMLDQNGKGPVALKDEVVGIIGFGAVGYRIAELCRALGMRVLVADRKHSTSTGGERTPFVDVLKQSTVVILCVPRNTETVDLISKIELESMKSQSILINVSRGGVVNEAALLESLKVGQIAGAATDVFLNEPAGAVNSILIQALTEDTDLPLIVTPHMAWVSEETMANLQRMLVQNMHGWLCGGPPKEHLII